MLDMIAKYTVDFPVHEPVTDFTPDGPGAVVLLTGSTGTLGSYILAHLISDPRVLRVYALNRAASGKSTLDRQTDAFVDRGLDVALLQSPKFKLITGDASREHLGVDESTYIEVSAVLSIHLIYLSKIFLRSRTQSLESYTTRGVLTST